MNLHPRISLLLLLLLTALVAGGIKLWYGPHHIVEKSELGEAEFSFTRDWHGKRIVDGPVVERTIMGGNLLDFRVRYFRAGEDTRWVYLGYVGLLTIPQHLDKEAPCPLSPEERKIFDAARDAELQRLKDEGLSLDSHREGLSRE